MKLESRPVQIGAITTQVIEAGKGPPLLFLHSGEGPDTLSDMYIKQLADHYRVICPWHPGFGDTMRPAGFRDIGDLAYFYLDLADHFDLEGAVLAGASFGGWIAAEAAIRSTSHFSHLVLADPFGVKAGGREARDIADIFAISDSDWQDAAFCDPRIADRDYTGMSDDELARLCRGKESLSFYGWKPFMHNPQLPRWLHRIRIPTLVMRGSHDRVVAEACHRLYADSIPGAQLVVIDKAGHYPHIEQPDAFVRALVDFSAPNPRAARAGAGSVASSTKESR